MRKRKPRAYLEKHKTGYWGFEPIYAWIAYDPWGNYITQARLKKDCERNCREKGYVPE